MADGLIMYVNFPALYAGFFLRIPGGFSVSVTDRPPPVCSFPRIVCGILCFALAANPRAPPFGLTLSDRSRLRIGDRRPDLPLSYLPKVPPGSPMNACARAFSGERRNCGDLLSWTANDVVSQFRRQNYNKLATLASICSPKGDHRHFFVKSTPAY